MALEIIFWALVAGVLWLGVSTRFLLFVVMALLAVSAVLFSPLHEERSELFLRSAYYILILVSVRELARAVFEQLPAVQNLKVTLQQTENLIMARTQNKAQALTRVFVHRLQAVAGGVQRVARRANRVIARVTLRLARYTGWKLRVRRPTMPAVIFDSGRKLTGALEQVAKVDVPLRRVSIPWRFLFFAGLTAVVTLPWFLTPGHLFLLDSVWPPTLPLPSQSLTPGFITSVPHEWAFWALSQVLATSLIQKSLFALCIFMAGYAMAQLVSWLVRQSDPRARAMLPGLVAGVFYSLNAFFVTRLFMGQIYLLLAYALTPWAVLTTLQFLSHPGWKRALLAAGVITATLISNAHHFILLPLLIIPFFIRPKFHPKFWRNLPVYAGPILLLAAVFLGVHQLAGAPLQSLQQLGPWARILQAPFTGAFWVDMLALTAHWKVDLLYAFPYETLAVFPLLLAIFGILMAVGVVYLRWRGPNSWLVYQLLAASAISLFFASGISHPATEPAVKWLYDTIPFWVAMRDSGKFLANMALVEAVFLGAGLAAITRFAGGRILAGVVLIASLIFVSPAIGAFGGQVMPVEYPSGWRHWEARLGELHGNSRPRMLVLPWHMYPKLAFLDNRPTINPTANYFTHADVVVGDNTEAGGRGKSVFIFSESARPLSRQLEKILQDEREGEEFGMFLAEHNFTYVALLSDAVDVERYEFLYNHKNLNLIFESPELVVWEFRP